MASNNLIGGRIRQVRKGKSLTQKDFAAVLGVSQGFYTGIETGRYSPSAEIFTCLAINFKVNINWLLTGEGPMYIENQGAGPPMIDLAAKGPHYKLHKQLERIVTEGDKKDVEALKGMLRALDPGEVPLEGMGDGENEGIEPQTDCA